MTTTNILSKTITTAAALVLCGMSAQAASLVNGTTGDGELFVGFRATGALNSTGADKNVVIDLGSAALFAGKPAGYTAVLGNVGANLVAIYNFTSGTTTQWYERTDLLWSAVSGNSTSSDIGANTLYGSTQRSIPGTYPGTTGGYTRVATNAQASVVTQIISMASLPGGFTQATQGATANIAIENTTDANSWSLRGFSGSPFSGFSSPTAANFEQAFTLGSLAPGVEGALDVFRMARTTVNDPDTGTTSGLGSYQISLTINSSGAITGTVLPVPEPTSVSLLMTGGLLFLWARRRDSRVRIQATIV